MFITILCLKLLLPTSFAYVNLALHQQTFEQYPNVYILNDTNAGNAVDGLKNDLDIYSGQCSISLARKTATWWVNLDNMYNIHDIQIYYHNGTLFGTRHYKRNLLGFSIYVSNTSSISEGVLCFKDNNFTVDTFPEVLDVPCSQHGQYVIYYNERLPKVTYPDDYSYNVVNALCEVEVYGCPVPGYNGADCHMSCSDADCRKSHVETGTCHGCDSRYQGQQHGWGQISCEDQQEGGILWNTTTAGITVEEPCPKNQKGMATRYCDESGVWKSPNLINCTNEALVNASSLLDDIIANETLDKVRIQETVNNTLQLMKGLTSSTNEISAGDLSSSLGVLEKIVTVTNATGSSIDKEVFYAVIDNILAPNNSNSWNTVSEKTDRDPSFLLKNMDRFSKITLQNENVTATAFTGSNFELIINQTKIDETGIRFPDVKSNVTENSEEFSTFLDLPKQITNSTKAVNYVAVLYKTMSDILGSDSDRKELKDKPVKKSFVNSPILSLTTQTDLGMLDPPLNLMFGHTVKNESKEMSAVCVSWDFNLNKWSEEGCTVNQSDPQKTLCHCSHLTNFAILMRPYTPVTEDSQFLKKMSLVGVVISIGFTFLTSLMYILTWRYIKSDKNVIMLNICASLILSYAMFISSVEQTANEGACIAITAIIHYLFLVTFFGMLGLGVYFFMSITVTYYALHVANNFKSRSRVHLFLIGIWGIPIIITLTNLGAFWGKGYHLKSYCWLSIESGSLYLFIVPVCIISMQVGHIRVVRKMPSQKKTKRKVKTVISEELIEWLLVKFTEDGILSIVKLHEVENDEGFDGIVADLEEGDYCHAPYESDMYPAKILLRSESKERVMRDFDILKRKKEDNLEKKDQSTGKTKGKQKQSSKGGKENQKTRKPQKQAVAKKTKGGLSKRKTESDEELDILKKAKKDLAEEKKKNQIAKINATQQKAINMFATSFKSSTESTLISQPPNTKGTGTLNTSKQLSNLQLPSQINLTTTMSETWSSNSTLVQQGAETPSSSRHLSDWQLASPINPSSGMSETWSTNSTLVQQGAVTPSSSRHPSGMQSTSHTYPSSGMSETWSTNSTLVQQGAVTPSSSRHPSDIQSTSHTYPSSDMSETWSTNSTLVQQGAVTPSSSRHLSDWQLASPINPSSGMSETWSTNSTLVQQGAVTPSSSRHPSGMQSTSHTYPSSGMSETWSTNSTLAQQGAVTPSSSRHPSDIQSTSHTYPSSGMSETWSTNSTLVQQGAETPSSSRHLSDWQLASPINPSSGMSETWSTNSTLVQQGAGTQSSSRHPSDMQSTSHTYPSLGMSETWSTNSTLVQQGALTPSSSRHPGDMQLASPINPSSGMSETRSTNSSLVQQGAVTPSSSRHPSDMQSTSCTYPSSGMSETWSTNSTLVQQGALTPSSSRHPSDMQLASPINLSSGMSETLSSNSTLVQQGALTPSSSRHPSDMQLASPINLSSGMSETLSSNSTLVQKGAVTPSSSRHPSDMQLASPINSSTESWNSNSGRKVDLTISTTSPSTDLSHAAETPSSFLNLLNGCEECVLKEAKIQGLEEENFKLRRENTRLIEKLHTQESTGTSLSNGATDTVNDSSYIPKTGLRVNRTDYVVVATESELPFGYQFLVQGASVGIPTTWLASVLHKLRKKEPAVVIKKLVDGLLQPWEIGQKGGTDALVKTKWEPVYKALQMFASTKLKMDNKDFIRAINEKMAWGRRTVNRLSSSTRDCHQ